jgi:hypothetical protein
MLRGVRTQTVTAAVFNPGVYQDGARTVPSRQRVRGILVQCS